MPEVVRYELRNRPGWGDDHETITTYPAADEDLARDVGGAHIVIPGNGWLSPHYLVAVHDDGSEDDVDCSSTFRCAHCDEYFPLNDGNLHGAGWSEYDDPRSMEPHRVAWVCESCWRDSLQADEDNE